MRTFEVEDLTVQYGKVRALQGVTLRMKGGELVSLIGANGAGKTTLLRAISGVVKVRSGRILLDEEDITRWAPHKIVANGIVHVPEGREVFPTMSVMEHLQLGMSHGQSSRSFDEKLDEVFALFPRLKERRRQLAGTLSGGEQQMLAIARALMSEPKLLLLDEPSLGLAPIVVNQVKEVIQKLHSDGLSILLVEQNANLALRLADRAYVIENGRVAMEGRGEALLENPKVKAAYLGV
jgi:branched-chain amino acid transport system ATP-binding protein